MVKNAELCAKAGVNIAHHFDHFKNSASYFAVMLLIYQPVTVSMCYRLTLKPFQMIGLNWLRIMHQQELNGILADEMVGNKII